MRGSSTTKSSAKFRFGIHSCSLVSPSLVCLIFEIVWLGNVGDRIEFTVLVEFVSLRRGLARTFRACFLFFVCLRGYHALYFLVLFEFIQFVRT